MMCHLNYYVAIIFALLLLKTIRCSSIRSYDAGFVKEINSLQSDWVAEENEFSFMDISELKRLMGLKKKPVQTTYDSYDTFNYDIDFLNSIPESFDSRKQWPQCESINSIKDQSNCGSCWAVSSASAMSDRLCIASDFTIHVNLSAEALMTCCKACTDGDPGCDGGYIDKTWSYWVSHGLVTGGDYGSNEGCQPYGIKPCPTCSEEADTPPCAKNSCTNKKYKHSYEKDIHKGTEYYAIPKNVTLIQADILKNGPLVTGFTVYEDFMNYKKGVYKHVIGFALGGHAVRILGWGVENNTPYWLVANSWNRLWGEDGLFKILRGTNECDFEDNVYAGIPQTN